MTEEELTKAFSLLRQDFPGAHVPENVTWRIARSSKKGIELDDIRTSEDNEAIADWMLSEVREACGADDKSEVHASLAGGRKTMSFLLGAAMQLCARPQDRLYHVLVPPEFEVRGFYFPRACSSKESLLEVRGGGTIDAAKATVDLAEVPFVRLAPLLTGEDLSELNFRDLMARANDALSDEYGTVSVIVPERGKSGKAVVRISLPGNHQVDVSFGSVTSKEFVVYSWLLSRQQRGLPPLVLMDREKFRDHLDDLVLWCEHLGVRGDELKQYSDLANELDQARRDDQRGTEDKDHVGEFFQKSWYDPLKVFPARVRDRLQKAFREQARQCGHGKYTIETKDGDSRVASWHVTIPPKNIILPGDSR
ncbi:MAG: CRISPR-associated ring nuclease Csm6 [Sumerlaeia bacterium]